MDASPNESSHDQSPDQPAPKKRRRKGRLEITDEDIAWYKKLRQHLGGVAAMKKRSRAEQARVGKLGAAGRLKHLSAEERRAFASMGGSATKKKGRNYYVALGKMGAAARKKMAEERKAAEEEKKRAEQATLSNDSPQTHEQ